MKKKLVFLVVFLIFCVLIPSYNQKVYADDLSDNIDYQLDNIDLTEIQEYFDNVIDKPDNLDFLDIIKKMLNGEFEIDYSSIFQYVFNVFFSDISKYIPLMISIICFFMLTFIIKQPNENNLLNDSSNIIQTVIMIICLVLLGNFVVRFYSSTIETLNKTNNLIEILSPILFSLMIASENLSSVSVFKLSNGFLSIIISNIIIKILIPIILLSYVIKLLSSLANVLNLDKLSEALENFVKKFLLLVFFVFGLFITIKGLGAKTFDSISIKATKYALSNSIPIVGSFVKDSFDVITAGSILIKNSLGISCVIILFFLIISPLINMFSFNILLKISNGIIGCFGNNNFNNLACSTTKFIDYLCAFILIVGFALFIILLLIILCSGGI